MHIKFCHGLGPEFVKKVVTKYRNLACSKAADKSNANRPDEHVDIAYISFSADFSLIE